MLSLVSSADNLNAGKTVFDPDQARHFVFKLFDTDGMPERIFAQNLFKNKKMEAGEWSGPPWSFCTKELFPFDIF